MRKPITPTKISSLLIAVLFISSILSAQPFQPVIKKTPSDRSPNAHFGHAVAISGNFAIAGAPNESEDTNGENTIETAGAAYFYQLNAAGEWVATQKIVASDRTSGARFGHAVAINGNFAIIGAFTANITSGEGTPPIPESGAAYIFHRNENNEWVEIQKITASGGAAGDRFGYSVAIENNYAVVGAYLEDEDIAGDITKDGAGAAYIYHLEENGLWTEIQKITASDRESYDNFGSSVAISGNYILVGAPQEDYNNTSADFMDNSGTAYIFEKTSVNHWTETQKITATDRKPASLFGWSVAICGNHAIIGTLQNDDDDENTTGEMPGAGAAYIFALNNEGFWLPAKKLTPATPHQYDQFGNSVTISSKYAAIGAYKKTVMNSNSTIVNDAGAAYIFELTATGDWIERQEITANDISPGDAFGDAIAISDNNLLIGATMDDDAGDDTNPLTDAGSIYFFKTEGVTTGYISIDACESYTVPSLSATYTESGTYTDIITNEAGLDSIITIDLTIISIDHSVVNNDGTLICSETEATYQWIDCSDNEPVAGANEREFTPSKNGSYAVIITKASCTTTSECLEVNVLGITRTVNQEIKLYPNPASRDITIDFGHSNGTFQLSVFTVTGKKLFELNNVLDDRTTIPVENLPNGVYFVKLQGDDRQQVLRFVKQ